MWRTMYPIAHAMAGYAGPQEYGITAEEKLRVGVRICHHLLRKVCVDLCAASDKRIAIGNSAEPVHVLDMSKAKEQQVVHELSQQADPCPRLSPRAMCARDCILRRRVILSPCATCCDMACQKMLGCIIASADALSGVLSYDRICGRAVEFVAGDELPQPHRHYPSQGVTAVAFHLSLTTTRCLDFRGATRVGTKSHCGYRLVRWCLCQTRRMYKPGATRSSTCSSCTGISLCSTSCRTSGWQNRTLSALFLLTSSSHPTNRDRVRVNIYLAT